MMSSRQRIDAVYANVTIMDMFLAIVKIVMEVSK